MRKGKQITAGLAIAIFIFALASLSGKIVDLNINILPGSFITHTLMLVLSIIAISFFKDQVKYKFAWPKIKRIFKPLLFGLLTPIVTNLLMTVINKTAGLETGSHPLINKISPWQLIVFVLFYASIAEELLFRGFLLNILKPLKAKGIAILKRRLSLSVIISGLAFGLAHLILLASGTEASYVMKVVVFTSLLGIIAGYYQEKFDNNAYAIIVHMSGNLVGVVGILLS